MITASPSVNFTAHENFVTLLGVQFLFLKGQKKIFGPSKWLVLLDFEYFLAGDFELNGLFLDLLTVKYQWLGWHYKHLSCRRGCTFLLWVDCFVLLHSLGLRCLDLTFSRRFCSSLKAACWHEWWLYVFKLRLNSLLNLVDFALDRLHWPICVLCWFVFHYCFWFFWLLFSLNKKLLNFLPALVAKNIHSELKVAQFLLSPSSNPVLGILRKSIVLG